MSSRKIPPAQLGRPEDIDDLARRTERSINLAQSRRNANEPLDAKGQRLRNVARAAEGGDAVPLGQLREELAGVTARLLTRPRRAGLVPDAFRTFTATHYQKRPELKCELAEPAIRLLVKLPSQVSRNGGQLIHQDLLKRNTEYAVIEGLDWGTLTASVSATATAFPVDDVSDVEVGAMYKFEDEVVRVSAKSAGTATVERAQERTEAAGHNTGTVFRWYSLIPHDSFTADDNGVLTASVNLDNPTRTHVRVFEGASYNSDDARGSVSTATASLAPAPAITDLVVNPQFGHARLKWSEVAGDTYQYRIYRRIGAAVPNPPTALYHWDTYSGDGTGVEIYEMPVPRPGDADATLGTWGDNLYAAVEAINILCASDGADFVGPFQGDASASNPASSISDLSASESPACGADGSTQSEVTVSWGVQPSDVAKVRIYMLKDGETNPTLVASADASPVLFRTPTIDPSHVQQVSIYAVSVNQDGLENGVLSSPSTTVDLDGQTSAPTPPTGFGCHSVVNGAILKWTANAECDLKGYEVADTGDVVPANQSSVGDAQVIAFVPSNPEAASADVRWRFDEPLYEGSANGTKITMAEEQWLPGAHVVDGTGKNVHFIDQNEDHQVVSNTADEIVFTGGSIPNGVVRFYIRAADGSHNFWVRSLNHSNQKSEWRPEPPTTITCSPLSPDATLDDGPPLIRSLPPGGNLISSWCLGATASGSLFSSKVDKEQVGYLYVNCAARSADTTADSNFDTADKRNINGVQEWEIRVDTTGTDRVFRFPAATKRTDYSYVGGMTQLWVLANYFEIPIPNANVNNVYVRARNFWGWGDEVIAQATGVPTGAGPYYTGNGEIRELVTETPSSNTVYPNLAQSSVFEASLTANLTVAAPEYRNSGTTKGSGGAPRIGETFTVVFRQDATGGRTLTWDSKYKIPVPYRQPSGTPNSYNVWTFYVASSSVYLCAGVPCLDIT